MSELEKNLTAACQEKDVAKFKSLLEKADEKGMNLSKFLHCAVESGEIEIIKALLERKRVNVMTQNAALQTPLHVVALSHGDCRFYRLLLGACIDTEQEKRLLNAKDMSGWNILHHAAAKGHSSLVSLILSSNEAEFGGIGMGFNGLLGTISGQFTPLHLAAKGGYCEIYKAILKACSTTDERKQLLNGEDRFGWNILQVATLSSRTEMVSLILSRDASECGGLALGFEGLLAITTSRESVLHFTSDCEIYKTILAACSSDEERKTLLNSVTNRGFSILHNASLKGDSFITRLILSRDASEFGGVAFGFDQLMAVTENGDTALHLASSVEKFQTILNACNDNDQREELVNAKNSSNKTCLHSAWRRKSNDVVQFLLIGEGSSFLDKDSLLSGTRGHDGFSFLHETIIDKRERHFTEWILEAVGWTGEGSSFRSNSDNNEERNVRRRLFSVVDNDRGWTALHAAVRTGKTEIVQLLMDVDVERVMKSKRDKRGYTPLHHAAGAEGQIFSPAWWAGGAQQVASPSDLVRILLYPRGNDDPRNGVNVNERVERGVVID